MHVWMCVCKNEGIYSTLYVSVCVSCVHEFMNAYDEAIPDNDNRLLFCFHFPSLIVSTDSPTPFSVSLSFSAPLLISPNLSLHDPPVAIPAALASLFPSTLPPSLFPTVLLLVYPRVLSTLTASSPTS